MNTLKRLQTALQHAAFMKARYLLALLPIICASSSFGQLTSYIVRDLHPAGCRESYAAALNNKGQVVGTFYPGTNTSLICYAFLISGNKTTNLSTLSGGWSLACGINDLGDVVGETHDGTVNRAFLFSQGVIKSLGIQGTANGINNHGEIVGYDDSISGGSHVVYGFVWRNDIVTRIGTLGGTAGWQGSDAASINNNGDISGTAVTSNGTPHAFVMRGTNMLDLGSIPDNSYPSHALCINDLGEIVGYAGGGYYPTKPFLYTDGTLRDLGSLGGTNGYAKGVNNKGQVVGESQTSNGVLHAFIYQHGTLTDLNELIDPDAGWTITSAVGINDLGQIAAQGRRADGANHALLLNPDHNAVRAVKPVFGDLRMGDTYQLQTSPDLVTWTNHGNPFVAASSDMVYTANWDTDKPGACFFRSPGATTRLGKAVRPSFYGLKLQTNYQLRVMSSAWIWVNHGLPFTATNSNFNSFEYWDVTNWNDVTFQLLITP